MMTGPGRLGMALLMMMLTAAAGVHCSKAKDPVMEVLAQRADYQVELKGFTEKRGTWGEAEGTLLSILVTNESKATLPVLTVRIRRFGPGGKEVLETRRLAIDVGTIASNRSDEVIIQLDGFVPGPLDALALDLEALPPEEEYGEFAELADALAARESGV